MNNTILQTPRLSFHLWSKEDLPAALALWGNPQVSRYITKGGLFSRGAIQQRLFLEIQIYGEMGYQYHMVREIGSGSFAGCCGFRPFDDPHTPPAMEFGIHLLPEFWGKGYGAEAGEAMLHYGFEHLKAKKIYAGHHPENKTSEKLLLKLGFRAIGPKFYEPTGLYHPAYEITKLIKTKNCCRPNQ